MTQQIYTHQFANGLTLLAESMDWLESAAFSLLLPAGCAYDPLDRLGLSNFTCEMVRRGCGDRTARQFVDDLENLGVDRSASVGTSHTSYGGAMPADSLYPALEIHADLVQRPLLPEDQLDEGRQVCLQEIWSVEDDLAQRAMLELRHRFYPDPFGRANHGEESAVEATTLGDIRRFFQNYYGPRNAILSVAGNIRWPELVEHVERLFGGWQPQPAPDFQEIAPQHGNLHLEHDSNQTHIGIAYRNVPYGHPDYYQARGAIGVLSDGMSSRLFNEVREKRGLCYTVYAICHSLRDRGAVMCYAGTTTDRAQETLDVTVAELLRLRDGVQAGELDRLKARIKTALIMQQESSYSRASSIAADWYFLNRVQTLAEVRQIIDGLTCDTINRYLADNPPDGFRIVTLGAEPLETPVGIS